ncbi:MAG: fimbria/pilus outer membrane usher protein, partial [Woeseia sp.]
SGSVRSGFTDWLTVEAHGEAASGLVQLGSGALVRLGQFGRLNASLSFSGAHAAGHKFSAGYQYVSQRFSITADLQQASEHYRDLPSLLGNVPSRRQLRVFLGSQLAPGKHVSAGYVVADVSAVDSSTATADVDHDPESSRSISRLVSVGYRQSLGRRVALSANAFHDLDQAGNRGVYIGLSVAVGRSTHVQTNYSSANERGSVAVARRSPFEGGWGWNVNSSTADQNALQVGTRFTGSKGVASLDLSTQSGNKHWMLSGRGALTMIGNSPVAGRYVDDAFAMVSTDGVGNVPVLHENRIIGQTNSNGYLMIPNLNAYQVNRIAIDPLGVPFNYQVGMQELDAVPRWQAGTRVTFPLENSVAAFSVSL